MLATICKFEKVDEECQENKGESVEVEPSLSLNI